MFMMLIFLMEIMKVEGGQLLKM